MSESTDLNEQGISLSEKGEYDQAIDEYSVAVRLDPGNFKSFYNRGATWAAKEKHQKAIEDYSEAIRLNPQFPQHFIVGELHGPLLENMKKQSMIAQRLSGLIQIFLMPSIIVGLHGKKLEITTKPLKTTTKQSVLIPTLPNHTTIGLKSEQQ